jgi:hypothetical protein
MHDVVLVKAFEAGCNGKYLDNLAVMKPFESVGTNNLRSIRLWIRLQVCRDITVFVETRYEDIPLHNKAKEWNEICVTKLRPDGSLTLESLGPMNVLGELHDSTGTHTRSARSAGYFTILMATCRGNGGGVNQIYTLNHNLDFYPERLFISHKQPPLIYVRSCPGCERMRVLSILTQRACMLDYN